MIKIRAIYYQTGESQEKVLTPEILIQGGGLIGRNSSCDLVLNSPEVSRVHGRILYQAGHYYYTDLGSTDGSQVNHQVVQTNQNIQLHYDDIIRIGGFLLLIKELDLEAAKQCHANGELNSSKALHPPINFSEKDTPHESLPSGDVANGALRQSILSHRVASPHQSHVANPSALSTQAASADQQLIFKAEELKEKHILNQSHTECIFQGKVLVEGISLAKRLRDRATELWQAELDAGKLCLLVEYPEHFTLWHEK